MGTDDDRPELPEPLGERPEPEWTEPEWTLGFGDEAVAMRDRLPPEVFDKLMRGQRLTREEFGEHAASINWLIAYELLLQRLEGFRRVARDTTAATEPRREYIERRLGLVFAKGEPAKRDDPELILQTFEEERLRRGETKTQARTRIARERNTTLGAVERKHRRLRAESRKLQGSNDGDK